MLRCYAGEFTRIRHHYGAALQDAVNMLAVLYLVLN